MPTYDLHQHLWPEAFIRALERRTEPPRLRRGQLELAGEPGGRADLRSHDLDTRLALLDRHGIDVACVSLAPTMETDPHDDLRAAYHEGILGLVAASNGRLLAFAEAECLPGFVGACLAAGALVAGADPLLEALARERKVLFVHPGPPGPLPAGAPPWWPAIVDYTAQMQAAYAAWLTRDAARYPALPVVFAILAGGAPVLLERLGSRGVNLRTVLHPNIFFDTSSYGPRALELCLATFGVSQIVHGSDAPVIDPGPTLAALRGFGEAVTRIVLSENTERLLEGLR